MAAPVFDIQPNSRAIAGGGTSPLRLFSSEFMYFPTGGTDPEQGDADWQTNANKQAATYELMTPRGVEYTSVLAGMRTTRSSTGQLPFKMLGYARSTGFPGGVDSSALTPGSDADHPTTVYNYDTETVPATPITKAFVTGGGAYIMRIWDPRWVIRCRAYYIALMADMDYDGTLIDVMGDYPATVNATVPSHQDGTGAGSQPWNPIRKSNVWFTSAEWIGMTRNLGHQIRQAIGTNRFCGFNGLSSGNDYWNNSSRTLLGPLPGGMAEDFIRSAGATPTNWPSTTNMKDAVSMLVDAEIWGWPVFCNIKFWPSLSATDPQIGAAWSTATNAQKLSRSQQWFSLGTGLFLLGTSGGHFLGYRHDNPNETYVALTSASIGSSTGVYNSMKGRHRQFGESYFLSSDIWWKRINLGKPTQNAKDPLWTAATTTTNHAHLESLLVATKTNMWARTFTNGVVVVNGHTADQTYTMPGTASDSYQNMDGSLAVAGASVQTIPGTTSMSADATKRNARVFTKL